MEKAKGSDTCEFYSEIENGPRRSRRVYDFARDMQKTAPLQMAQEMARLPRSWPKYRKIARRLYLSTRNQTGKMEISRNGDTARQIPGALSEVGRSYLFAAFRFFVRMHSVVWAMAIAHSPHLIEFWRQDLTAPLFPHGELWRFYDAT